MTVENFKKAMEKASLDYLKQTEANLLKTDDKVRLAIVKDCISKIEEEQTKKEKKK